MSINENIPYSIRNRRAIKACSDINAAHLAADSAYLDLCENLGMIKMGDGHEKITFYGKPFELFSDYITWLSEKTGFSYGFLMQAALTFERLIPIFRSVNKLREFSAKISKLTEGHSQAYITHVSRYTFSVGDVPVILKLIKEARGISDFMVSMDLHFQHAREDFSKRAKNAAETKRERYGFYIALRFMEKADREVVYKTLERYAKKLGLNWERDNPNGLSDVQNGAVIGAALRDLVKLQGR